MNPRVKNSSYARAIVSLTAVGFCLSFSQAYAETVVNGSQHQLSLQSPDITAQRPITLVPIKEPTAQLVLAQALAQVLTGNPKLAAFSQETRAREAATLQATLLPNPKFRVQAQNFGNNKFKGADGDAITIVLSQLVELGGKRAARTEVAILNHELANWDYETQRINVLTQVTQAYIEVLAAQQRLHLAGQLLDLARKMVDISTAKVRSGSVAPLEETKAKVIKASAQIDLQRTQKQLLASRQRLASTWGSTEALFQSALGDLEDIQPPPELQDLIQRIQENPDLARWATEINQRQAFISMEKSKAIPDITFNFGTNTYLDGHDYNMNAGFSMPLPLFDRNQGSILAAQRRLNKAEDERRNAEINTMTALNVVYQQLHSAYVEVTTLRNDVIPGAESAFKVASRGYRLGEYDFLQVLDAQRTLVGVKTQYIQAQTDYHLNVARIERLIGGSLNPSSITMSEDIQ
ncbi:outer membrane protein, cobalt-zinc-cadmium efflux system [Bathymodiolus japonicus methanotrophic gill symbiont]|uniref:TolC family protein n=1 Tax=Bathymodiolus japonicus methanotrophic gill symbiont TaxID=113269 RepID=UPI001B5F302C|nr:TolC family protein [Bathymodiolus japonicus methanotrophic gill symbiont]GFO71264.1 outer membrane protein, cobalt-zinc-cadmium efflux system [Bathymodiolus japonicus methanotrophic gill symbiont]